MTGSLTLGPFVLPHSLLLLMLAVAASLGVAKFAARKLDVDVESIAWQLLIVGLLVARLAYVWEFRLAYLEAPLSIIDIRDGGWNPTAGLAAAWLLALLRAARRLTVRRPLLWAMTTGTAVWLVGTIALTGLAPVGPKLLPLQLTRLEGPSVVLDEFKGRPTVVNLWATWCPPCQREMPVLQQAQQDHPSINFVFLNQGESTEQVQSWLTRNRLTLRNVLLDEPLQAAAAFGQHAYPTTLFFDADGAFVARRIGELSTASLTEKIQLLNP